MAAMVDQPGFFDLSGRLRELSAKGDDLERIAALVDFGQFRLELAESVYYANSLTPDGSQAGGESDSGCAISDAISVARCVDQG